MIDSLPELRYCALHQMLKSKTKLKLKSVAYTDIKRIYDHAKRYDGPVQTIE